MPDAPGEMTAERGDATLIADLRNMAAIASTYSDPHTTMVVALAAQRLSDLKNRCAEMLKGNSRLAVRAETAERALDAAGRAVADLRRQWIANAEELRKHAAEDDANAKEALAAEQRCYVALREEYDATHTRALKAEEQLAAARAALESAFAYVLDQAPTVARQNALTAIRPALSALQPEPQDPQTMQELQEEIARLQERLARLAVGDQMQGVSFPTKPEQTA